MPHFYDKKIYNVCQLSLGLYLSPDIGYADHWSGCGSQRLLDHFAVLDDYWLIFVFSN